MQQNDEIKIIRKRRGSLIITLPFLIIFAASTVVFILTFWASYTSYKVIELDIKVTATQEVVCSDTDKTYYLKYSYSDDNGRKYTGRGRGGYKSYEEAGSHIGETIEIYIDPKNGYSTRGDLKSAGNQWSLIYLPIIGVVITAVYVYIFFIPHKVKTKKRKN